MAVIAVGRVEHTFVDKQTVAIVGEHIAGVVGGGIAGPAHGGGSSHEFEALCGFGCETKEEE